jgi:hypothetical protein
MKKQREKEVASLSRRAYYSSLNTPKSEGLFNKMDITQCTLTVYEKEDITNLDLMLRYFKELKGASQTSLRNKGLGKDSQQKFTLEV